MIEIILIVIVSFIALSLIAFWIRTRTKKRVEQEQKKFNKEKISVESACQIIRESRTTTTKGE